MKVTITVFKESGLIITDYPEWLEIRETLQRCKSPYKVFVEKEFNFHLRRMFQFFRLFLYQRRRLEKPRPLLVKNL